MNARLIGVVAITILASAGCKSKTPASNSSSTVVQAAAPSGNAQPTAEASRASLTPPKAKLLDNDDEYIDLKEGRGKAVEGCISTYEQTVAALKQTRDARVMAKVGNISDAGLRKQ